MTLTWARAIDRDTSSYEIDGDRIVSVTEALSLAGVIDFSMVPPDMLERAAKRGKAAHAITAAMDQGEDLSSHMTEEVAPYVAAYEKFRADTAFEPELIEHSTKSKRFRFAGTLDRLGWLRGRFGLADIKCAVSLPPSVGLQLAGYEIALQEEGFLDGRPVDRFGLQLKPNGTYHLKPYTNPTDRADFLACVRVAQYRIQHLGVQI